MADAQIPAHCACGCRTPINENLIWMQRMRSAGVPEHVIKRNGGHVDLIRFVAGHEDALERERIVAKTLRELRSREQREAWERRRALKPRHIMVKDRGRGRDAQVDLVTPVPEKIVQGKRVRLCVYCSIDAHYRTITGCPCWCHR